MAQILQEVPSFGTQVARGLGTGIGAGLSSSIQKAQELLGKRFERKNLTSSLIDKGISPKDAELYSALTEGGKTHFAKDILESRKRNLSVPRRELFYGKDDAFEEKAEEEGVREELEDYLMDQDEGLTPSERVKRGSERYKTGLPVYQKAAEKLRSLSKTKGNLDILDDLRKSKKLPKLLGRLNVDAEGNLKFPFASSPEAQRFVKTINEFSAGAKDTYGSRVTNFDLAQYLKQFPSLLNSEEGIKQLVEQLKIVNDINSVYYKNLKNVYDKAGGVRSIDADVAESLADKMSQKSVEKLTKKFSEIGTEKSLPPAHKNKGERFMDDDTGEIYVSDGKNWIKEE